MYNELSLTVICDSLNNPNNGVINCSVGDDGVHVYNVTCSFTCNTGYELNQITRHGIVTHAAVTELK